MVVFPNEADYFLLVLQNIEFIGFVELDDSFRRIVA